METKNLSDIRDNDLAITLEGRQVHHGVKIFDIVIPSTANSVAISSLNLKETCVGAIIWKKQMKDSTGVWQLSTIPMHEALPDVNTMWVVDWKLHANTIVPEIYTWIKQFLANDIQTKHFHLCNRLVVEKPVWSPEFRETILDVINSPVVGDVTLDFVYRSKERECPEHIEKEFIALLHNINIRSYKKITLGYQQWPDGTYTENEMDLSDIVTYRRREPTKYFIFDIVIDNLSQALCIDPTGVTQTCEQEQEKYTDQCYWVDDNYTGIYTPPFNKIPIDVFPDPETIHILDWKIDNNTVTEEIIDWVTRFINNSVTDKALHLGNSHHRDYIGTCPYDHPDWHIILKMLNENINANVKLSMCSKGYDKIYSENGIRTLGDAVHNIQDVIENYRYVMVNYQDVDDQVNVSQAFYDRFNWATNDAILQNAMGYLDMGKLRIMASTPTRWR